MASIIPENSKGKSLDIEHQVVEATLKEAGKTFDRACKRLLNPSVWYLITGEFSAKFTLQKSEDRRETKLVDVGDYLAIDVPGPGLKAGDGFDWVRVELLQKNTEPYCDGSIAMRLRASKNPSTKDAGIAHFFDGEATSTFIIKRMGKTVYASYHGRNEIANTVNIPLLDKLRNKVVATGAEAGLSKLQWEALIKGFLQPEIGG